MTAVLLTPPYLKFFDSDGVTPLAGGKVYTYTSTGGTFATPKATYTNAAGSVAAPNPVILDSNGVPETGLGGIWLSGTYDFKITDANDVQVGSQLAVTAFTALAASSTAYFESFSGTGAQTVFTTASDLGTDEKAIYVWVKNGLEEHVTNGTFATDTDWTKGAGWTIGSGVATAAGAISTAISQTSAVTVIEGQAYSVTFTITRSAGGLIPSVGGRSGTERTASGTYTDVIVAGSTETLAFTGNGFTGTLDTVSITPATVEGYEIQNPNTYTIDGTTLTFTSAPASGTNNIYVSAPSLLVGAASSSAADAAASAAAALASETQAGVYAGQLTIVSTTSLAIGTGSKVFTVASGLSLNAGQFILIASDAAPSTNYMWGTIASYSGTTLTVTVAATGGSGTLADWTMYLTGERGATGATGSISDLSGVSTATVADADYFVFMDVNDANATKRDLISNIKGGVVLISTQTASTSAAINFTGLSSTYRKYIIDIIDLIPATDGTNVFIQFSNDNGSSYVTSNYTYVGFGNLRGVAFAGYDNSGDTGIRINEAGAAGNAANESLSSTVQIYNPASSSVYKNISFDTTFTSATTSTYGTSKGGGNHPTATAVDAVRVIMSAGNITSGTFKLYGVL